MSGTTIPVVQLKAQPTRSTRGHSASILEDEIKDTSLKHVVVAEGDEITDYAEEGSKSIYLFIKGEGTAVVAGESYAIVPECILLPNVAESVRITSTQGSALHYVKISCRLTARDLIELEGFPTENTQEVYYVKFSDCQPYTEPIKSPNTVSRTILPNKYIPRVAMGTVQTLGPDEVGAHEHPMLEQLFLGLADNSCVVYADDAQTEFRQYDVLHIPLGSRHSVSVGEGETLYYVWMDFFLTSKGEEWLDTHIVEPAI